MRVRDKVVWITGASSGIGQAVTMAMAKKGARVALSSRREGALDAVRASCAEPEAHLVVPLDLAQPGTFGGAVDRVLHHFGRIDVLVHSGGISQRSLAHETSLAVDRRLMEVNYLGTVGLTKAVLPAMLAQGRGHIAVVSSLTGKIGAPTRSAYSASKHALHGFFDALRGELASQGISVTLACPGFVRTDISRNALTADATPLGTMTPEIENGIPPERCARAIIRAIEWGRHEFYVGGWEQIGVYVERLSPRLFNEIICRITPR